MIASLINDNTFLPDVDCKSWEELVDIAGAPLIAQGSVEPAFLQSIKDTVAQFGAYMVLVDDVAFFHGRPEAGVNEVAMSLAILKEPVYLNEKRIKAAFVFAAVDNKSHLDLLSELAWSLDDDEFLFLLRNHGGKEELMAKLKQAEEERGHESN